MQSKFLPSGNLGHNLHIQIHCGGMILGILLTPKPITPLIIREPRSISFCHHVAMPTTLTLALALTLTLNPREEIVKWDSGIASQGHLWVVTLLSIHPTG